jgi:16S rRNA (guanine(527)-N(7))-methyltransferase RsmG
MNTWDQSAKIQFSRLFLTETAKKKLVIRPEELDLFFDHYLLIREWNKYINLTAIDKLEDYIELHLMDCLLGLSRLDPPRSMTDAGSGGGFPGIVAAIMWPETQITLVESNRKKCSFLRIAATKLSLTNVKVNCQRVERAEVSDMVITRAAFSNESFESLAAPIRLGGELVMWLAAKDVEPLSKIAEQQGFKVIDVKKYFLAAGRERAILILNKVYSLSRSD